MDLIVIVLLGYNIHLKYLIVPLKLVFTIYLIINQIFNVFNLTSFLIVSLHLHQLAPESCITLTVICFQHIAVFNITFRKHKQSAEHKQKYYQAVC